MMSIRRIMLLLLFASLTAEAKIARFYTIGSGGKLVADEPEFTKDIADITGKIDALIPNQLALNLIIRPMGDNASFDSGNNIEVPRQICFTNDWGLNEQCKTTYDIFAVYAHEYGHAVFDTAIAKAIPPYAQIQTNRRRISELAIAALNAPSPEQRKSLAEAANVLEKELMGNESLRKIYVLTLYYHELFADTIAVFTMENKSAIYEALLNPNVPIWKKDQLEFVRARDFASPHPAETWSDSEVHNLFAPMRSLIGSDECWPKTLDEKRSRLKSLATLLLADLVEKYKAGTTPVPSDNIHLIEKFKEVCR